MFKPVEVTTISEMNSKVTIRTKSEWTLNYPHSITLESNVKVIEKKKMIANRRWRLLIVEQILLVSTIGNVRRTVWRI